MTGPYPPPQQPDPFQQGSPAPGPYPPGPQFDPPPAPAYGQPPYGQPPYGGQPSYGQPPQDYGPPPQQGPPYGAQPQYGVQPQYPPPGYTMQPPSGGGGNRRMVIALVAVVATLLVLCTAAAIGAVFYFKDDGTAADTDEAITGLIDYRTGHPEWLAREHRPAEEKIDYPMTPPAGGPHHGVWQRCLGDVYTAPIDSGNAVHSLEHGAVWITYRPDLPAADVAKLAARVKGKDFTLLSPFPGQPGKVSLQAWGYQLRVESVDDKRIDAFLLQYRQTASMEPGVTCSDGSTATGG